MQREKLYNLQCKAYLNCLHFFQNKQYSERPIPDAADSKPENFAVFLKIKSTQLK